MKMDHIDPLIYRILELIELQTSRKIISFADAKWLSAEMHEKKIQISSHTLARLFGVIKPFRKPYRFTLDGLARFSGFPDWQGFSQSTYRPIPGTDLVTNHNQKGFSISRLEVAIVNGDPKEIIYELERFNLNYHIPDLCKIASKLVHYIRTEDHASGILQHLAQLRNGHKLFYEFFADEDDPDEYYSKALYSFYLPEIKSPARKLFVLSFLISKEAYRNNRLSTLFPEFLDIMKETNLKALHYQELSRYYECMILHDGFARKLDDTIHDHKQQIIVQCNKRSCHEASWLLYRTLRAMVFFGYSQNLTEDHSLGFLIERILKKVNIRDITTADFAIQLFFLVRNRKHKSDYNHQPFKLQSHYLQFDSNERQSMELATGYLLSVAEDSEFYKKNLLQYCSANSATWVCKLFD
jgi:hypothetical protein